MTVTPAREQALARLRRARLELESRTATASLYAFVRQAWHVLEPSTPFVDGQHIAAICLHLEAVTDGRIRNLIINMPPRHMKSLLVSVFWPAWVWITHPEKRWLFASYAMTLALRDNLKMRRLIESPWYRERFGESFTLTSDQNAKTKFDNDKTGGRIATAVGAAVTGEGGDTVVVDDAHNVMDAESEAVMLTTTTWWDEAMSTRLNNPETGSKVILGQRVKANDLSGHAMERGEYELLSLPAEYEVPRNPDGTEAPKHVTSIGWSDWRVTEGELLWPQRFTVKAMSSLKIALGSYGTAGQLQQRPSPRGGSMVQRSWFRWYTTTDRPLLEADGTAVHSVDLSTLSDWMQSWDCSFKDKSSSDYVCGGVFARKGAAKFLIYRVKERMDLPTTVKSVRSMTAMYPKASLKLVEDKANGPAVIATLKDEISGIVAVNPQGDKVSRFAACTPTIEAGDFYLPDPRIAPWVEDYIAELLGFPKGVTHDDQVDMTSQALNRYLQAVTVRVW